MHALLANKEKSTIKKKRPTRGSQNIWFKEKICTIKLTVFIIKQGQDKINLNDHTENHKPKSV